MRVMSAGDGFRYLLRTVAAGDGDRSLSTPLTRYYADKGTPPGFWLGTGVPMLGAGELRVGDTVSETQLELLLGRGRDPITGDPLGRGYPVYAPLENRIAERIAELGPTLTVDERATAVTRIEAEETAKGTRRAVAGFDFTFSVPKSVSVLWAVADAGTQALIVQAHHEAVAEVIALMEREVAATRTGATGRDGAVAQVDTFGLIATAYDHYDSRSNDPHLHTHVVVSNKVKTVLDGRWRSLDGRPMHAAVVALSELHEGVIADHLTRAFGLDWEPRERGEDRNPTWDVAGVPMALIEEFSSRSAHIDREARRLVDEYVAAHGRQPSKPTILKLRAQATLSTRPEKQIHSLYELTMGWRQRAARLLGKDATGWARDMTGTPVPAALLCADDMPLEQVEQVGRVVVGVVSEKRSTWRRWNLYAEASRQIKGWRFASTEDRETITGMIADAAEATSLRLTPPELAVSPPEFQRGDGISVFRPRYSELYSSQDLLNAEDRLLTRSRTTEAPLVSLEAVEEVTARPDRHGRVLSLDQAEAITAVAVSGRTIDVLVGPAGAGKTTAMTALRTAWEAEHGPGSVIGLAPSAVAADVLADDLGIPTENTAKWLDEYRRGRADFHAGQLVIVDEASLAGTLTLDTITWLAQEAGAKVLLVGDWAQLQSVDAGGAFSLLVHDRDDAPELADIHRFVNEWEKLASLELRHGRPEAVDSYEKHGRIRGGETETITETAYTAWRADLLAGKASILVAQTREIVGVLNERARLDRVLTGEVDPEHEINLVGGFVASAGDVVITRHNDRRLRAGNSGWVHNGDRWRLTRVHGDGSVTVRRPGHRRGGSVVLPADYVAEHLDLGYAVTGHGAQGVTVDTAHAVITPETTRETLYVALTRGRQSNIAYVVTDRPDELHGRPHDGEQTSTAVAVFTDVLQHIGAEPSAHEAIAAEQKTWTSIAQLAAEYETIAAAAQRDRWVRLIRGAPLTSEQAEAVLASDAFSALTAELRRAEANSYNLDQLVPRFVASRQYEDADDIAAVLHYRVAKATARPSGAGRARRPSRLIVGLIPEAAGVTDPAMQQALTERAQLMEQRADALTNLAMTDTPPWITTLGTPPRDRARRTMWMRQARVVAAYRDRYGIASDDPLGSPTTSVAQQLDHARAQAALDRARLQTALTDEQRTASRRAGPDLGL
ncbi:MobF family relaxase [Humibacter ginsenosidimutans]|uniref:AAA family ATPase n=1 Tax=Humibacter ginsenosidimutans TaxID=2599293 RepID=A0A5B8M9D9_9MICO|nr:MobF family relaxase [Humibacter ginsenosidimutans]QDZ16909.1 AAA family ATPase [Humibacter ginsenosidimutans]